MTLPEDPEIWNLAATLIARHGDEAPIEARRRAEMALLEADMVRHGVWLAMKEAIEELSRAPAEGENVH
jgi:hypothetical protein